MWHLGTLAVLAALATLPAGAGTIEGTALAEAPHVLPPEAVLEAVLEDISRADAPALVLGRARVAPAGPFPIPFVITFADDAIDARLTYGVRGRIIEGDRLTFTTTEVFPVLTGGYGRKVTLRLDPVAGAAAATSADPLPGSFTGTLPCADCPGIDWQLDLLADGSYQLRRTYQDRPPGNALEAIGRWARGSDRRSLVLVGSQDEPIALEIRDHDTLRLMDRNGRPIRSTLPYDLTRAAIPPLEPELTMSGMYRYLADAGRFTECLTGRSLPVATLADNAALERAYLEARVEPGAPLLATVRGRIARLPPMEGAGTVPQLEPLTFIRIDRDATCEPLFTEAPLEGTHWRLVRLGDAAIRPADRREPPGITLDSATGRFAGSGGCNRLMGGYTLKGDTIAFAAIAGTMMYCEGLMETEAGLIAALEAARGWRVLGRELDLRDDKGTTVARFVAD